MKKKEKIDYWKISAPITEKEDNRIAKKNALLSREWYSLRSILSYDYMIFYFLLGGRETGKSYSATDFCVGQFIKYGRPFYWLRLTDTSQKKLLTNNAEKLIDPDLRRKYNLDLVTNGTNVYRVIKRKENGKIAKKKLMARVLALSTFYNDKGSGFFDKDFLDNPNMYYNIVMDEMNREANEKNTFDIVYAFTNQIENLVRSTKHHLRIICIGNTLAEASDLLGAFNFMPIKFGRFKLVKNKKLLKEYIKLNAIKPEKRTESDKKRLKELSHVDFGKRAIIEYMEPTEVYKNRRHGTVADILASSESTFTNKVELDTELVTKERLIRPISVIMFRKEVKFTVWDSNIVSLWNGEKCPVIAMRPYLDANFTNELRDSIIEIFDNRGFRFHSLIAQTQFKHQLELLKPRKG